MEVHTLTEHKTNAHFVSKVLDGPAVSGTAHECLRHVLVRWSWGQRASTLHSPGGSKVPDSPSSGAMPCGCLPLGAGASAFGEQTRSSCPGKAGHKQAGRGCGSLEKARSISMGEPPAHPHPHCSQQLIACFPADPSACPAVLHPAALFPHLGTHHCSLRKWSVLSV